MASWIRVAFPVLAISIAACEETPTRTVSLQQEAQAEAEQKPGAPAATARQMPEGAATERTGKVVETMNSGGYTYVRIDTGTEQVWAAGPQTEVAVGDQLTMPAGMAMTNFRSNTLSRSFDLIYFVPGFRKGAAPSAAQ